MCLLFKKAIKILEIVGAVLNMSQLTLLIKQHQKSGLVFMNRKFRGNNRANATEHLLCLHLPSCLCII